MSSKFLLTAFGIIVSSLIVAFYFNTQSIELEIGTKEQIARADIIRKKIDQFAIVSDLLSHFIQEDISADLSDKKLTQLEIEKKLEQYLRSSPPDIIFGIGLWFEPYSFERNKKFFGPYVHRSSIENNKNINVLTYEWNTEAYNYPAQPWFTGAYEKVGTNFFSPPYFDNGLVYITNSNVFFDINRKPIGVISVDLVLPQLQNIIKTSSLSDQELIYIADQNGMLLAHPLKDQFFKTKNIIDGKDNQSLLNFKVSDVNLALGQKQTDWIQSTVTQEQFKWTIVVKSSPNYLLKGLNQLKKFLIFIDISLWILLFIIWQVLQFIAKEKAKDESLIELGKTQLVQASKMAALGEMASGVAHEINNPLTIIVGKAQQIKMQLDKAQIVNEDIENKIKQIVSTADRIKKIIDGLRTFSRSGEKDPLTLYPLEKLITETLELCTEKFKDHRIPLEVTTIPNVLIQCRPSQISQVILNLLLNSIDAVENLSEKWVKLQFHLSVVKPEIHIEIIDSGRGIAPEISKRLMEPFFTTKDVGKGTGLGLSISKGIIDEHHGKLELEEDSPNTKFVIILPIIEENKLAPNFNGANI